MLLARNFFEQRVVAQWVNTQCLEKWSARFESQLWNFISKSLEKSLLPASSPRCSESTGTRSQTRCISPRVSLRQSNTSQRMLASNIARVYDILGWYSPTIIKVKILLQQLWVAKITWDDLVPSAVQSAWERWSKELPTLGQRIMPRCYFPTSIDTPSIQLHGFCDASELAYGGVTYLRALDSNDSIRVALVMAKTKVAPLKNLSMPRLELCGAVIVARLLNYCRKVFEIPISNTYAWTDSTVVLSWVRGNPRRFKPFVGNRVAEIMDLIPPEQW